jgi:hypothetical protein
VGDRQNTIVAVIGKLPRRPSLAALLVSLLAATLLSACGSGSETGSDQFREQTDSPVLDFGEEGSEADLEEGGETVSTFLAARAAGDWREACAQVSRPMLAKIDHLATTATDLADKSCPSFLGTFTQLSAEERRNSASVEAGSIRLKGKRAYVIYSGDGGVVYAMPLSREGDAWKVASLAPERLE